MAKPTSKIMMNEVLASMSYRNLGSKKYLLQLVLYIARIFFFHFPAQAPY